MGGERKQLRILGEAPVLVQTVRKFAVVAAVEVVVVSTGPDMIARVEHIFTEVGLSDLCRVVAGGDSRQASVAAGLEAVSPDISLVLVHDAVRPFVAPATIRAVIEAVREAGAGAAAIPVADTVRRSTDGWFGEMVDRRNLYRMQTPQGFRRDWLEEAHRRAARQDVTETDDVALVQRCGHRVRCVPGTSTNFKITTPADWQLAQVLWEQKR
jgi:2-C-methyl-D-erythritol 4-phosphate cytidylyltransferase